MTGDAMQEWLSWEPLIIEDLKRAERKIQLFYSASSNSGGKKSEREKFVAERLPQLVLKATEG